MAEPGSTGTPAPAQRAAGEEQSTMKRIITLAQQVFLIYAATQVVTRFLTPTAPTTPPVPAAVTPGVVPSQVPGQPSPFDLPPQTAHLSPEWSLGTPLDMHVHLSTSPFGDVFSAKWTSAWRTNNDRDLPSFVWENITFGNWKETRVANYDVHLPETVQRNASMWADVFLVKQGASPDPNSPKFDPRSVHHIRKLLTRYLPKVKVRKEKNLLSSKAEEDAAEQAEAEPDEIVSYWHNNLTLALISDAQIIPYSQIAAPIYPYVNLEHGMRDASGTTGYYRPIVFPNDFWHLKEQLVEINATTSVLPLQVIFQPMSYMKFNLFASMTVGFETAAKQQGSGSELDEIKRMFVETNPWFLALTAAVSLLHMLFEMLAFTSDVSHWRNKKELVGVSVRTIATNVFVQIVILLYLIDNNENTSWMIILTSGMGAAVEAWKVTKAVDIKLIPSPPGSLLPYKLDIKDKHVLSNDEKKTQEYDKLAFRYVSYVAIPLLAGYTIYSLLYNTHKGWYSFIISTLTSFVYMFGFAQLVPQLIINYKLKSVAHMPMKAMIYKTLSTVVDDFFAFCIKMPFLHRLACFRDDVVFLIFLYQRWIYRIDPNRVNEYGQVLATDVVAASTTPTIEGKGEKTAVPEESRKDR